MSEVTLEEICSLIVDCEHKTAPEAMPGTAYGYAVGTPHIRGGRILLGLAKRVDRQTYEKWTVRETPREHDLILAREAPVGQVGRVRKGERVCLGQRTVLLRPNMEKVDPGYLHFLMQSSQVQAAMASKASGSTVAHLNVADIRQLLLPSLPPLSEQHAIAAVLGALDDKIAVNERIAATADELAEVTFKRGTSGQPMVPMSQLVTPLLGGTPDRQVPEYWGSGVPWASAKDIAAAQFGVVVSTEEEITQLAASSTRVRPMPAGSVILTARGTVGAVARVTRPTAINQSCYAFVPGAIPASVLFCLVQIGSERMLSVAHGTVFSTVNMKTFDHVLVPQPSAHELAALESAISPFHKLLEQRLTESSTLATLRDTLLPQLMTGQISVRQAESLVEDAT